MRLDLTYHGHHIEGGGGTELYVESTGDSANPAIVFMHGFCQCRLSWDVQFQSELAREFHLVRYDIRGHGLSGKPADPAAFQDTKAWADDLDAVIRSFKLDKPVLCGWSYGGYMICDYIRHYGQERIGGLNFVDAVTEMGSEAALAMFGTELVDIVGDLLSAEAARVSEGLQQFIGMATYEPLDPYTFYLLLGYNSIVPPHVRQAMFSRKLDNTEILKSIRVPALVTRGENDRLVNAGAADHIARHVKGAERKTYPKCGHVPFVEKGEQFNRDLAAFARKCAK